MIRELLIRFPRDDIARGRGSVEIVGLSKGLAALKKIGKLFYKKKLSYLNGMQ
jgi:hypothetical protein